jgi:hypothetical protein
MILSNDPCYGSHLAGDQGQLSILHMLIEVVSEGQLVVGRTKLIYRMTSNSSNHGTETPYPYCSGVDFTVPCLFTQTSAQYSAAE